MRHRGNSLLVVKQQFQANILNSRKRVIYRTRTSTLITWLEFVFLIQLQLDVECGTVVFVLLISGLLVDLFRLKFESHIHLTSQKQLQMIRTDKTWEVAPQTVLSDTECVIRCNGSKSDIYKNVAHHNCVSNCRSVSSVVVTLALRNRKSTIDF